MKFTSAIAATILSLVSLSSADQISVATIYRYVDATATVYQNYCPCAATGTKGLTSPTSTSGSGTSGAGVQPAYVNNNAGSNNIGSGQNAQGAVTTVYSTVYVQYVTSTQLSYYTTTVYPAAGSTVTQVITNTATVTVPVTVTSTITATVTPSGGAAVAPGQQSTTTTGVRYSNSTTTALDGGNGLGPIAASVTMTLSTQITDTILATSSAGLTTISVSAPVSVSIPVSASTSVLGGGGGVAGQPNTLLSTSSSTSAPASTSTGSSSSSAASSASSSTTVASTSSSTTTAAATSSSSSSLSSTSAIASSTTSSADSSSSTSAAPGSSTTSIATTSTTSVFTPASTTSSTSSAPTPQYTLNLQVAAFGQDDTGATYYNDIWVNTTSGLPSVYYNPPNAAPDQTTNVNFVFGDISTANEIYFQGQRFAYDTAALTTGTPIVLASGTTTLSTTFTDDHSANPNFSVQGVTFYFYPATDPTVQMIYTSNLQTVKGNDIANNLCYTFTTINSIQAGGSSDPPPSVTQ